MPQEKPVSVELSASSYEFYANDNNTLTTWTGYAAPDWAAGAKTLDAMAGWAYGPGLRYEGDKAKVKQWTGTTPARPAALIGVVRCSPAYIENMPTAAAGGQRGRVNTQTKPPKITLCCSTQNHAMMS